VHPVDLDSYILLDLCEKEDEMRVRISIEVSLRWDDSASGTKPCENRWLALAHRTGDEVASREASVTFARGMEGGASEAQVEWLLFAAVIAGSLTLSSWVERVREFERFDATLDRAEGARVAGGFCVIDFRVLDSRVAC
jgi:hypothetical protein